MAQAHCMQDNAYCFSTATMVTRTYLNVTFYVPYIASLVLHCVRKVAVHL
jgi:hypothetical protein